MVTCRPFFSWPGKAPLDQPGDDGAGAEGALHQRRFRQPFLEIVAEHVLREQIVELTAPRARSPPIMSPSAPAGDAVIVADEAERPHPRPLQPPRQQHAERLVGEPALERIGDEIEPPGRAERSRPAVRRASAGAISAAAHAARTRPRRAAPPTPSGLASMRAHARGQKGRERKLAAGIGGDLRVGAGRARASTAPRCSLMPSKRSTSPAKMKVSPGVSVSAKYSSTSPSTRPPRVASVGWPGLRRPLPRPSRTLSMLDSTMVPTFMRYCWITRAWLARQRPALSCRSLAKRS